MAVRLKGCLLILCLFCAISVLLRICLNTYARAQIQTSLTEGLTPSPQRTLDETLMRWTIVQKSAALWWRLKESVGGHPNAPRNMKVTSSTKLSVFLHFHKAGGSSIVKAAQQSTQNLYSPNGNGNPLRFTSFKRTHMRRLPFWAFGEERLIRFLSQCLNENSVTFIAMENQWFENVRIDEHFKAQHRIELVTQLREPFDRFVSDFFYSLRKKSFYHGFRAEIYRENATVSALPLIDRLRIFHSTPQTQIHDGVPATNAWNMFVRVLSHNFDANVTERDLQTAIKELNKFDLVSVLELPGSAALWERKYGLRMNSENANARYQQIYAAERNRDAHFDAHFEQFGREFAELNRFDYLLYEHAKKLHEVFAAQLL